MLCADRQSVSCLPMSELKHEALWGKLTFSLIWRRKGFTLIELLVVITIISILACLLLPVLTRTKEKAREISCSSNIKQIGLCLYSYMSDESGCLPPAGGWYDGHNNTSWVGALYETGIAKPNRVSFTGDNNTTNIENDYDSTALSVSIASYFDFMRCPRDAKYLPTENVYWSGYYKSCYGLVITLAYKQTGTWTVLDWIKTGIRPFQFSQPSKRALVAETSSTSTGGETIRDCAGTTDVSIAYPHGSPSNPFFGRGNILHIDAHVESMTYNDVRNINSPTPGYSPFIGNGDY